MSKLQGKVTVITGGSSGIGLATARAFVNEGAQVVITGRRQDALDEAVAGLGKQATGIQGDVSERADLERLFQTTAAQLGKIDVLFVNAGIAPMVPFAESDEALFDKIFSINAKGVYFTVQRALPHLNDGASVILNASVTGQIGLPGLSIYSASKAAVRSFARTMSTELAPRRIRVNAISPGLIETPIFAKTGLPSEEVATFDQFIAMRAPSGRLGKPDEIAQAVVFLASDDASYVVGAEFTIDGGLAQV